MSIEKKLQYVAKQFRIPGEFVTFGRIKIGNVNQTYTITYRQDNGKVKKYIVQRVNTYAFREPEKLMSNIDLVTEYIHDVSPGKKVLHFHHTEDRANYIVSDDSVWRLCNYIESITFNEIPSADILRKAGIAFGHFQHVLSHFDVNELYETIPNFHNTRKRLETLFEDAERDDEGRACEVKAELDYIRSVYDKACILSDMRDRGELPIRVTHNDTKLNNVLFHTETKEPIVIVDLDTVMPGLVASDFGDAVRYACNTVAEDSQNYARADVNMELFRAFAEGFLSEVGDSLTENEINTLALSCFVITVELASRFLDDYLNGDKYFTVNYGTHNLVRTRCQLALAKKMEEHMDEMDGIIKECLGRK